MSDWKLDIALKEWQVIVALMLAGDLALLLRKGGIEEDKGPGRFEMVHPRFLLFPAWSHQKPEMLKSAHRDGAEPMAEPDEITLRGYAEAARIWQVPSREALDSLDDLHPWSDAHLDMRWNYRPENPLYLVAMRVHRLAEPKTIPNRIAYGGCKSWVELESDDAVRIAGAEPVLDDATFTEVVEQIDRRLAESRV